MARPAGARKLAATGYKQRGYQCVPMFQEVEPGRAAPFHQEHVPGSIQDYLNPMARPTVQLHLLSQHAL